MKYNIKIDNYVLEEDLKRITNQIYKLLPNREEGVDWIKPLQTLMTEVSGLNSLLVGKQHLLLPLLCKMEGLFNLTAEEDFFLFRRTIFDCLNILNSMVELCHSEKI